ncbi:MAG: hypothetical protein E7050_05640 [Lentisphaerae bacterium]|nr:hypothetical protein [Lentisphaerota bacterium]
MKKFLFLASCCAAFALSAAEVANFDFTGAVPQASGKYSLPRFKKTEIGGDENKRSLYFDGKDAVGTLFAKDFHILKGGSVVVKLKIADKKKNLHMIVVKPDEWWLARQGNKIYFNFCQGNKQAAYGVLVPCDWSKETTIGVSVFPDDTYIVCADGKVLKSGVLSINDSPCYNDKPITIGNGWGSVWSMLGDLYALRLYDEPLAEAELIENTKL